jgi:SNF2 family DNA or RNA helicase
MANHWQNMASYLELLRGHPFADFSSFLLTCTNRQNDQKDMDIIKLTPEGTAMDRFRRLLNLMMVARPESVVLGDIQVETHSIRIKLTLTESALSADSYLQWVRANKQHQKDHSDIPPGESKFIAWNHFLDSQYEGTHPMMKTIMEEMAYAASVDKAQRMDEDLSVEEAYYIELTALSHEPVDSPNAAAVRQGYLDEMKANRTSLSTRVDAIVMIVHQIAAATPKDKILIVNESPTFLEIIRLALENDDRQPFPDSAIFVYTGEVDNETRNTSLKDFAAAPNTAIMLASRATMSIGLNIQFCNHVIRCQPWWVRAWEKQIDGRCIRPGQKKTVHIYEVCDIDQGADSHRQMTRERKNDVIEEVLKGVVLVDGHAPSLAQVIA